MRAKFETKKVREALALPPSGYASTNKASSNCGRNSPRMSAAILAGFSRRRRWGHHRQREEADKPLNFVRK